MEISKKWTLEERMKVVLKIASTLTSGGYSLSGNRLLDVQDRLIFLATESKEFLDANKRAIIDGSNMK